MGNAKVNSVIPMKETRFFKGLLSLLPILIIGVIVIALNLVTPKEPEAPKNYLTQDVDQATILLAKPISAVFPERDPNPHYQLFQGNIYDTLVTLRSGKIEASLAASWKNIDQNTWQIVLRKDIKFTSGAELSSRDVKFSLEEAVQNKWPVDDPIYEIAKVEVIDDHTLTIKTKTPVPNLVLMLKSVPILQKDTTSVGTGPYKLVANDKIVENGLFKEQTITLEANEDYFAKKPRVKKLVYKYLGESKKESLTKEDVEQSYQLIEAGALKTSLNSKLLTSNFSKVTLSFPSFSALFINQSQDQNNNFPGAKNPLAQNSIRKALALGLDPRMVMSEASITGKVTGQLASSVAFGYDTQLRPGPISKGEAKKILKENGFEKGFTFTLDLPASQAEVGKSIAKQLKELGIIVKLHPNNSDEEIARIKNGQATVFLGNWLNDNFDTTSTFTTGLLSQGSQNYTSFSSQEIDNLVEQLRSEYDLSEREKILHQAMAIAVEEKAWLPLWEDTTVFLVNDRFDVAPATSFLLGQDIAGK